MRLPAFTSSLFARVLLSAISLASLAAVAGSSLAPHMPLATVLIYSAIGAAAFFVLLVIATLLTLTFRQFVLHKGGTDTQWFWFASEPKGLVALRQQRADRDKKNTDA